jgi:murein lipoprotein
MTLHRCNVKSAARFILIMQLSLLLGSCSTNSDIENLQTQIDGLKTTIAQASSDAAAAQSAMTDALAKIESLTSRVQQFENLCSNPKKK